MFGWILCSRKVGWSSNHRKSKCQARRIRERLEIDCGALKELWINKPWKPGHPLVWLCGTVQEGLGVPS